MLIGNFDSAAELMATAWQDVLASCHFPASHWHKLLSPNPLERDNEEIDDANGWLTSRCSYTSSRRRQSDC